MTMPKVKCTSGIGLAGIRAGLEQPAGLGVNHDGALPDAACCWLQTSSGELDLGSTVTGGCSQEAPAEAAGVSQEDPGELRLSALASACDHGKGRFQAMLRILLKLDLQLLTQH